MTKILLDESAEDPLEPLADPVEQWLQWEEQANLVGFRTSTQPVEVEVTEIPSEFVSVEVATEAPPSVVSRFLRDDRVLFPKHPLNRDLTVAFSDAPVVEHWTCRYTSSRTLVAQAGPGEPLFSLKLATDHPHPNFLQPEKTRLREEATWGLDWVELVDRVDRLLGPDPGIRMVREVLVILAREGETACMVRDLRSFQDGSYYLPGLSLPWVGRQIAQRHGESFAEFWGRHWAEPVGRAKATLLARYGLWYDTPNPQNILLQLDPSLQPTGVVVFRDGADTYCATDADTCTDTPWSRLVGEFRIETRNSFWAFGEAGDRAVSQPTLEVWYALHDRAYFDELARWFPELAPRAVEGVEALTADWTRELRSPEGAAGVAAAFGRRLDARVL
jgi:hypothetical protein